MKDGFWVAVDGGQSSTLALVAQTDGTILGVGLAGPSNHIDEPGGLERLRRAIEESTGEALREAGVAHDQVNGICLGMTGTPPQAHEFAAVLFPTSHVQAYGDLLTALMGAGATQPGVVVIAGTGSAAYGRLEDGREARAGGWGYLIGDEGSAYAIGQRALQAVSQALDGRAPATALHERVLVYFGLSDFRAVRRAVYSPQVTRERIAGLAAEVDRAARDGDGVAQGLLYEAGKDLAKLAIAALRQLNALEMTLPVFTTGGVFRAGDYVLLPFLEVLGSGAPRAFQRAPRFSPVVGALFLALKAAGIQISDDMLARVLATLPNTALEKHQRKSQALEAE